MRRRRCLSHSLLRSALHLHQHQHHHHLAVYFHYGSPLDSSDRAQLELFRSNACRAPHGDRYNGAEATLSAGARRHILPTDRRPMHA